MTTATSFGEVPIMNARADQCRYALWSDGDRTGDVCGLKVSKGASGAPSSYCPTHYSLVYVKPTREVVRAVELGAMKVERTIARRQGSAGAFLDW